MAKTKQGFTIMDREAGRRLFLELTEILTSLQAQFFLIQGTALGAYRDHDFVPEELDIDLGFLMENFSHRAGDIAKALREASQLPRWVAHALGR